MSENELKAEKMRNAMAWTCDYCHEHGDPMSHGCLSVNLKKEISHLTQLLSQERDDFGKKETELMQRISDLETTNKAYRECLVEIDKFIRRNLNDGWKFGQRALELNKKALEGTRDE